MPHFEKMLYDNALLARAYLHGYQRAGAERWRAAAERTLDWMLAEMRGDEGGFYSALDADSEGEEGRFYVWTADEFAAVLAEAGLSDAAAAIAAYYGVTERGNFEGANVLHLAGGAASEAPPELDPARAALLARRAERRLRPGLDDKRLASWNALAIAALRRRRRGARARGLPRRGARLRRLRPRRDARRRRAAAADLEGRRART